MNRHGFTLMEILAVLLTLAVVIVLALPGIRAMRAEVYYYRAKAAASKMAEAARSYYKDTRGREPARGQICGRQEGCPGASIATLAKDAVNKACSTAGLDGIPAGAIAIVDVNQLFACKYLTQKDFVGLPYRFAVGGMSMYLTEGERPLVMATGMSGAGRYEGQKICVYRDGTIRENC